MVKILTSLHRPLVATILSFLCLSGYAAEQKILRYPNYEMRPRALALDTYVIAGMNDDFNKSNGCNIINTGFIVTKNGVLVINSGPSKLYGAQQRKAIEAITAAPIRFVLNLNLHPDYFFGNQSYSDIPIGATAKTIAGMTREGNAYADNLYHICGDWMAGTESKPASQLLNPDRNELSQLNDAEHQFKLVELNGHTASDLILIDTKARTAFVGGLVFSHRIVTTPHANIKEWLASLNQLAKIIEDNQINVIVPSHGDVEFGMRGITETHDYLVWLDSLLRKSAESGLDLNEVMRTQIPSQFQDFAALKPEFLRNVIQLYPQYERSVFSK